MYRTDTRILVVALGLNVIWWAVPINREVGVITPGEQIRRWGCVMEQITRTYRVRLGRGAH